MSKLIEIDEIANDLYFLANDLDKDHSSGRYLGNHLTRLLDVSERLDAWVDHKMHHATPDEREELRKDLGISAARLARILAGEGMH